MRMRMSTSFKVFVACVSLFIVVWIVTITKRRSLTDLAFLDSQMQSEITRLQLKIKETQDHSSKLEAALQQKGVKPEDIKTALKSTVDGSFHRDIHASRKLTREYNHDKNDLNDFIKVVTVLVYADGAADCVSYQVKTICDRLPGVKVVLVSVNAVTIPSTYPNVVVIPNSDAKTEGQALNKMIESVKTPFFLYLSQGTVVSPFNTDNGPGYLLHALQNVPELDFIGGSILAANKSLRYAQLEVQCYRLRMCYYAFSQSYEYKYSVGDVMVCEETSTSFMARKASLEKVGKFDETLNSMVTTDFFWRAKGKALAGLRPEVYFLEDKKCAVDDLSNRDASLKKQAFMEKYELERVKDSYGKVIHFPDPPRTPPHTQNIWGRKFNYVSDGGFASPVMTEKFSFYIRFFEEFFTSHNITYFNDAGIPLGGIKLRNVLPWDTGDVDAGYFDTKWSDLLAKLKAHCEKKKVKCEISSDITHFKLPSGKITPGLKTVYTKIGTNHRDAHYDKYSHEWEAAPKDHELMYVYIDGTRIPVFKSIFQQFRSDYGLSYLVQAGSSGNLVCKVKGHHACVPEAFKHGGGHWREFYCNI